MIAKISKFTFYFTQKRVRNTVVGYFGKSNSKIFQNIENECQFVICKQFCMEISQMHYLAF